MKSSDLRFGNWISDGVHELQVSWSNLDYVFDGARVEDENEDLPHLSPIPFTKEWARKCEMSKIAPMVYQLHNKIHIELERNFVMVEGIIIAHCPNVHDVQNLYKIMVKSELKISL